MCPVAMLRRAMVGDTALRSGVPAPRQMIRARLRKVNEDLDRFETATAPDGRTMV
jgi:hypothetical protein